MGGLGCRASFCAHHNRFEQSPPSTNHSEPDLRSVSNSEGGGGEPREGDVERSGQPLDNSASGLGQPKPREDMAVLWVQRARFRLERGGRHPTPLLSLRHGKETVPFPLLSATMMTVQQPHIQPNTVLVSRGPGGRVRVKLISAHLMLFTGGLENQFPSKYANS